MVQETCPDNTVRLPETLAQTGRHPNPPKVVVTVSRPGFPTHASR